MIPRGPYAGKRDERYLTNADVYFCGGTCYSVRRMTISTENNNTWLDACPPGQKRTLSLDGVGSRSVDRRPAVELTEVAHAIAQTTKRMLSSEIGDAIANILDNPPGPR